MAGTVGRAGGQAGKRVCFLTVTAFVAILGSQFVTILSPRRFVRAEKRGFPGLEKRHNPLVERLL